jgi:hypothetical protein
MAASGSALSPAFRLMFSFMSTPRKLTVGGIRSEEEHTVLAGFGSDVIAQRIGDFQLCAAQGTLTVYGSPLRNLAVVGHIRVDLPLDSDDTTVIHRRRGHGGVGAIGIDRLLENVPTGAVGGHRHAVADGRSRCYLVAVVAVGAIGVFREYGAVSPLDPEKMYLPFSSLVFIRLSTCSSISPISEAFA